MLDGLFEEFQIKSVYLICAVVGGAILGLQMILLLFGGDVDADTDVDTIDGSDGFGVLSIRSIASFLTFFGLSGLACQQAGWETNSTLGVSIGAGIAALFIVGYLMSMLTQLQSSGNVNFENAVGTSGKVYLRIPANYEGQGKVTVVVQKRTMQCAAVTAGAEIPTGRAVRVIAQTNPNTLEVTPLD